MNEMYPVLKLNIFDKFNCKADKCNISCCKGWGIVWSQEECNKIFSSSLPELATSISENNRNYTKEMYEERPILKYVFDIKYLAVRILTDKI